MCKNDLKIFLYLIKKEIMMRNYVNRFARNSFVRFNSTGTGGSGGKIPAGPHVLIPLLVGYYLIFKEKYSYLLIYIGLIYSL